MAFSVSSSCDYRKEVTPMKIFIRLFSFFLLPRVVGVVSALFPCRVTTTAAVHLFIQSHELIAISCYDPFPLVNLLSLSVRVLRLGNRQQRQLLFFLISSLIPP